MSYAISNITFEQTKQFSSLFLDYIKQDSRLTALHNGNYDLDSIKKYIKENPFNYLDREELQRAVINQYGELKISKATENNIHQLISKNTFTITTGHQLCLFTGPLYFIYKIITCITISEYLNKNIEGCHFVPVYWMATEDHDFAEINHAHLFNKTIEWKSEQSGKVGSFELKDLQQALSELQQILGDSQAAVDLMNLFDKCYKQENLAVATRVLVNELFAKYGLVIIDGDDKKLKTHFKEEIKKELETGFSFSSVTATSNYLKEKGYPAQVNPREINLFYAKDHIRERIEKKEDLYSVNNTELQFTKEAMDKLLNEEIEVFSPNVILRPLYQQKILPNIAYVGGPGELAYWLQLKKEFDDCNIHFPLLVPRKFALIIDVNTENKLTKLEISKEEIFEDENDLIKKIISSDEQAPDFSEETIALQKTFQALKVKAESIDKTLAGTVDGELQKALKGIENISQKTNRALKTRNDGSIQQLKNVKTKLFPNGSGQERFDNFIPYYLKNENFIDDIKSAFETDLSDLNQFMLLTETAN